LYIWRSSSGVTKPNVLRLICSELLLDHLRVPTGYPSAPYWWLLRAVDLSGSIPSQRHFSWVSNNCQLALFRPLKAVARVRIPSGLQVKPPLTRPDTTTSQPAFPRVARQGRARDARTPTGDAFGTVQISRLRCPNMGSSAGRSLCCREAGPRLGPQGALERRASTIKRHYRPNVLPDRSATAKHVRSALRMRDVDRSSRWSAASRTSHPLARTGGENDQRA
jgi:hypothetical protein